MVTVSLDNRILELIAVGASVAANCQPCLEYNVDKAREFGADGQEIAEAIEVGKRVRQGAAAKLDKLALSLIDLKVVERACGCDS
jgi:AhpD family alkylhydroperoxidase